MLRHPLLTIRRGFCLFMVFVTLGGMSAARAQTPAEQPTTRPARPAVWLRITAEELNVRSRPDANSVIVTRVPRDAVLQAVGKDEYGWYRILPPDDVFSFVAAPYVERRGENQGVVAVQSGTLRVRVGSRVQEVDPMKSEVQTLLPPGATVHIVGQQEGWYRIAPPPGVHLYVAAEHVAEITPEEATRLSRRALAARAKEAELAAAVELPASQPLPTQPALTGDWGQKFAALDSEIETEAAKPLLQQVWKPLLERLGPIADQRTEPMVARLAGAWQTRIEQHLARQRMVREAEEVLRKAERDQAQHEREMERLARVDDRRPYRRLFSYRGELLRSYAVEGREGETWYKLQDPLTQRVLAYLVVTKATPAEAEQFVGRYVGVRGAKRGGPDLGADILSPESIVPLEYVPAASQPARETP